MSGENGLLYTIKLNTTFDKATGRLDVSPEEPVKFRYTTPDYVDTLEGNTPSTRWWGMENSPVAWSHYLYFGDNGGKFMCVDLNTMDLVWAQDILDDSNTSPLFEESLEEGTAYIYTSASLHITGAGDPLKGQIPIWKINAATGDIVWESEPYTCTSRSGARGGVQGTGLLGEHDIANLVIYPIAGTPTTFQGLLVALDKRTGAEVWRFTMANYAWSSPVAVYTPAGKSYIVICDSAGKMFLLDGVSGQSITSVTLSAKGLPIEASPAVFEDTIVIGTRGQRIYGIDLY
jgi:outer membrane protein assembly factor BamB